MEHTNFNQMIIYSMIISYFLLSNVMLTFTNGVYNHLNKIYMTLLMGATMAVVMYGMAFKLTETVISSIVAVILIIFIRKQFMINDQEFIKGMIEHHDMALLMSKELTSKTTDERLINLTKNIQSSQQREIDQMRVTFSLYI